MKEEDIPLGMKRLVRNYGTYSVLVAGFVTIWSWAGWGFPFVMAKDYNADKSSIEARLSKIESALNTLSTGQLEAQELQLQTRAQDLERELAKTSVGDPLQAILTRQLNEAMQGLARVRRQLNTTGTR